VSLFIRRVEELVSRIVKPDVRLPQLPVAVLHCPERRSPSGSTIDGGRGRRIYERVYSRAKIALVHEHLSDTLVALADAVPALPAAPDRQLVHIASLLSMAQAELMKLRHEASASPRRIPVENE
jgi:hypothetical protein